MGVAGGSEQSRLSIWLLCNATKIGFPSTQFNLYYALTLHETWGSQFEPYSPFCITNEFTDGRPHLGASSPARNAFLSDVDEQP